MARQAVVCSLRVVALAGLGVAPGVVGPGSQQGPVLAGDSALADGTIICVDTGAIEG
ncbi:hypothetical protein ACFLVD_00800 [Chloroflexota bacterium]